MSSGELRKHRTRLRLTGHPLQILGVLLERPNQVVGREELQQRLWNGTTFVDFQHGLNAAINRLRQTLGDSADQPRYVETIPGQGYRFIAQISNGPLRPVLEMLPVSKSPVEPAAGVSAEMGIAAEPEATPTLERQRWKQTLLSPAAAVVGLVLAAAVGVWLFVRFTRTPTQATSSIAELTQFRIDVPPGVELSDSQTFSLSPDGRTLVYVASANGGPLRLWVQSLDSLEPRSVPFPRSNTPLFWSPDSKFMAFQSEGKLKKMDPAGNPAEVVGPVPGTVLGGDWNRNGTILFGTETGGIMRVEASGGDPVPVTVRDPAVDRVHAFPVFLPDGRHFLYSRQSSNPEKTGVFVGSLDLKPEEQSPTNLIATPIAPQFVASQDGNGIILFQRETTLWAQNFDTSRLQLTGEPKAIAEGLGRSRAFGFSSTSSKALIYRRSIAHTAQLTWFDRSGKRIGTLGAPADLYDGVPRISPDGTRVAFTRSGAENTDIWVHDLTRDVTPRVTFDPAIDQVPIWSPDGKTLVSSSSRAGHFDLYQTSLNGNRGQEVLYASSENKYATSSSADGKFLLYSTEGGGIWLLPLEGPGKHTPVPFLNSHAEERSGIFSPDSQWIAFVSSETGQPEVYVQPFSFPPASSPGGSKVLLSHGGGTTPRWRADGKEIFYRAPNGMLMAASITTAPVLQVGTPKMLFHSDSLWDVTGDGKRFLVGVLVQQGVAPFTAVLNWQSGLKK